MTRRGAQSRLANFLGRKHSTSRTYGKIPTDMIERLKRTNSLGPYRGWMDSMTIAEPNQIDGYLGDGYKLLDVRPSFEREEKPLPAGDNAVHVALYEKSTGDDKKVQQFLAWAQGTTFTEKNEKFVEEVKEAFPELEEKIVVGCEGGVRSILAVKELEKAGYSNLVWIGGGMDSRVKST
mmetsp:Transcript_13106/g.15547  ORF Transcript_13106/g.15547 Transcript_13106/m.15547 type:complete len:179 (+) Transcript_13106:185-721(+)